MLGVLPSFSAAEAIPAMQLESHQWREPMMSTELRSAVGWTLHSAAARLPCRPDFSPELWLGQLESSATRHTTRWSNHAQDMGRCPTLAASLLPEARATELVMQFEDGCCHVAVHSGCGHQAPMDNLVVILNQIPNDLRLPPRLLSHRVPGQFFIISN